MTINELIKKIEDGNDIMLTINNKKFTILTWCDEGIVIDQQHPNDGNEKNYKTASELVERFTVDGKTVAELIDTVTIDYYS